MAKSAVRAMDAVQAWAKEKGKGEVTRFVVTGGLEAGLDHLAHRRGRTPGHRHRPHGHRHAQHGPARPEPARVWGKYSEQIDDYVKRGLMERAKTPEGTELWKMVDPYTFRDRLTMPKLLINGANDRYWTLNAIDLYWNGLKGPKYLVELPNAGHGLDENRDWALNGLGAFFRYQVTGRPMPAVSWRVESACRKRHVDHSRRPGTAFGPALDGHRFQPRLPGLEMVGIAPGNRNDHHRLP